MTEYEISLCERILNAVLPQFDRDMGMPSRLLSTVSEQLRMHGFILVDATFQRVDRGVCEFLVRSSNDSSSSRTFYYQRPDVRRYDSWIESRREWNRESRRDEIVDNFRRERNLFDEVVDDFRRHEWVKDLVRSTTPTPAEGLDLFVRILTAVANAVALKFSAALSLRPAVLIFDKTGRVRCVCAVHALTTPRYALTETGSKFVGCLPCLERQALLERSIDQLRYLCILASACLFEEMDATEKRFLYVKEEREFERSPYPVDDSTDLDPWDQRLALLELRDEPLPVKPPPKPYVPVRIERPTRIDESKGVQELLLELS